MIRIQAHEIRETSDSVIGEKGTQAKVLGKTIMASGVMVYLETEFGSVQRVYDHTEPVKVERPHMKTAAKR